MRTKLNKKEIFLSLCTFIIAYIVLLLVMFLNIAINSIDVEGGLVKFITDNYINIITVALSAAFLTAVIYAYFFFENRAVFVQYSKMIEIYLILALSLLICNAVGKFVSPTARPLLFMAFMCAMIIKRREAVFVNTVFAIFLFIFNRYLNSIDMITGGSVSMIESFSSLLTIFCAGIIGIFVLKRIRTRLGCVMLALISLIPVILINIVLQLPSIANINIFDILHIFLYSAMDCILSVLLFMFMLPIFESVFSELTSFRLRELTSESSKLIKMLKTNALGTYNHSVVVAQLAEACADAIGEDTELARAAAYYHDVGKLNNPEMFAENQTEYDLHKELTPELSVDIIRSHARDGAKLIRKNRLPEFFATIAVEHHGTLPIKYFYAKALKMSDGELNAGNYSYPGPTPSSKIAAIIMIADAAEAATRSLPSRSPEKVEALVRNLVEERINLDQFAECDITMHELTVITRTCVNSLTGVYHSRVAYPKLVLSKKK